MPPIYESEGIVPKLSIGYQNTISTSGGIIYSFTKIYNINDSLRVGVFSTDGIYLNAEIVWSGDKIYGMTFGYEFGGIGKTNASALGIEFLYLRNAKDEQSLSIAPKIGLPMGFLNLYYSYQFGMSSWAKDALGKHRFTLSLNLDLTGLRVQR